MQRHQINRMKRPARNGFTLAELLVVIAIIAILAALGAWAAFAMAASRQRMNTEATLRVLNKMMLTRWAAVVADAKKETPSSEVLAFAGGNPEVARVLWIKVRLVEAFPMRYSETSATTDSAVNRYIPTNRRKPYFNKYQSVLAPLASSPPPVFPAGGESSACLLMALNSILADGTAVDDQMKHAIATTDGKNNINTLVDAYGTPFKFQRFFTGADNPAKNSGAPNARNRRFGDTTDNDGRLLVPVPGWYSSSKVLDFEPPSGLFHVISTDGTNANYVIPIAWSAGRDKAFVSNSAFPEGNNMTIPTNKDNIFSYNLGVE